MEIGATVCVPNGQPHCEACPLSELCLGRQYCDALRLPQRTAKKARRQEQYTVFVLQCDGKFALRKRTAKGLLHGLWEYPNVAGICTTEEAIAQASAWHCKPTDLTQTVERKHIFTHVEWELYGVYLTCARQDEQIRLENCGGNYQGDFPAHGFPAVFLKAIPHKERLATLHAICLQISRHISQKCS